MAAGSSAMSIDVALSTRRGVGRDPDSLPQKNAAAPRDHVNGHGPTKLRPGAMSMDMALLSCAPGAMSTDFVFVKWIHSGSGDGYNAV